MKKAKTTAVTNYHFYPPIFFPFALFRFLVEKHACAVFFGHRPEQKKERSEKKKKEGGKKGKIEDDVERARVWCSPAATREYNCFLFFGSFYKNERKACEFRAHRALFASMTQLSP